MLSISDFYRKIFSCKVYKIALDSRCSCPNRDGSKGVGGCIFCSEAGSGDFAPDGRLPVSEQISEAKNRVLKKVRGRSGERSGKFIAYFQNFSATYGEAGRLKSLWLSSLSEADVVGLSLATRPDCLSDEILGIIGEISGKYFVQIELGLQTSNEETGRLINRCYTNEDYVSALSKIRAVNPNIHVVTHLIFGLPGESEDEMIESVKFVVRENVKNKAQIAQMSRMRERRVNDLNSCERRRLIYADCTDFFGIKITSLYVLKGTPLEKIYSDGKYSPLSKEEYFSLLRKALLLLPGNCVVHRLTGDPPKRLLVAPEWTTDKKRVLNEIRKLKNEKER